MARVIAKFALWMADRSTRRAAFWNDVAEAWMNGETIAAIRERRMWGG